MKQRHPHPPCRPRPPAAPPPPPPSLAPPVFFPPSLPPCASSPLSCARARLPSPPTAPPPPTPPPTPRPPPSSTQAVPCLSTLPPPDGVAALPPCATAPPSWRGPAARRHLRRRPPPPLISCRQGWLSPLPHHPIGVRRPSAALFNSSHPSARCHPSIHLCLSSPRPLPHAAPLRRQSRPCRPDCVSPHSPPPTPTPTPTPP